MIKKKVCLLGVSAVGKTSLVRRFVHSIFSEKYHSTLGVKVDTKKLQIDDKEVDLLIWDIHGDEEYKPVHLNYLKGSAGFLLVADGTRADTLEKVLQLKQRVMESVGELPFVLLLNKYDLSQAWELGDSDLEQLKTKNYDYFLSSAKTGEGVEEAFQHLARQVLNDT